VKASGPSRVTLESRQDRFLELMMQMCDGGEFAWIKRKVQDAVKRFLREVKGC
jgi:predicted transcriptional regulator